MNITWLALGRLDRSDAIGHRADGVTEITGAPSSL